MKIKTTLFNPRLNRSMELNWKVKKETKEEIQAVIDEYVSTMMVWDSCAIDEERFFEKGLVVKWERVENE